MSGGVLCLLSPRDKLSPVNLEELERAVQALPAPDFKQFSAWFDEWRSDQWDRQFEQDVLDGKLDHLAEAALTELRAGQTTRLP